MQTETKKQSQKNVRSAMALARKIAASDMHKRDKRELVRLLGILKHAYMSSNGNQVLVEMSEEEYENYIKNK